MILLRVINFPAARTDRLMFLGFEQKRWDSLTVIQKQKFIPLAPDFALELMSPSDNLIDTQAKMREYLDNGVRLGWLINPEAQQVEIYCLGREMEFATLTPNIIGREYLTWLGCGFS